MFNTEEILEIVQEVEAEMTAQKSRSRPRKRKLTRATRIVEEQSLEG